MKLCEYKYKMYVGVNKSWAPRNPDNYVFVVAPYILYLLVLSVQLACCHCSSA